MKLIHPLLGLLSGAAIVTLSFTGCSSSHDNPGNTPTVPPTAPSINQPPVGTINLPAGNASITTGQSVTFAASVSDPNGDLVTVLWDFGDGTTSTALAPPAHAYNTAGSYHVSLTATDSQGLVDPNPPVRVITVQAVATNLPPAGVITAPAANITITPGGSVTFTGTASDPNGDAVTVLWNFGDGTSSTALAPGAHVYATAGTYTVSFTATDSQGLADPAPPTRTITVQSTPANAAPVGVITAPAASTTITAGQSVTFTGTASDPNGDVVTVLWNFGDGSTSTALAPGAHVYATAGTYTVTFTATDSHGLAATTPPTRTITVNAAGGTAATLTQVQATVFNSCAGCHGGSSPSAGMNLSSGQTFSNTVNVSATTLSGIRIVPFSSATSALVTQVTTNGHHSPSAANLILLKSWIDAGALNN